MAIQPIRLSQSVVTTPMRTSETPELTVYFDGACPVCRREIGFYSRRTGEAVSYCDVATQFTPTTDLSREAALARFHVRLPDDKLLSGAAAFLALWACTPGFRYIARPLSARPVVMGLDVIYALFLKLRRLWRPQANV